MIKYLTCIFINFKNLNTFKWIYSYIEITSEVSGTAPVPILGVGVRQNGALVDGQIDVVPGTPLTMEVSCLNYKEILMSYFNQENLDLFI